MSRLSDWGIDALDELEDQIEEVLEEEYQRGRSDGYAEAADEATVNEDILTTFERLRLRIIVDVHQEHEKIGAIQFCSHPLCRAYVEHRESLGVRG